MALHWNSKNAILQDLSVAQGREVPVEIKDAVASGEKPPALNYTEETEEEFYKGCVSSGDVNTGPDLELIQHMLDLVREVNITDIENINSETIVETNKAQFPQEAGNVQRSPNLDNKEIQNLPVKVVPKMRKKRNVALASLIEIYGDNTNMNENIEKQNETSAKLLKPDDFMSSFQSISSVKPEESDNENISIIQSPKLIFKRKASLNSTKMDNNILQENIPSPTMLADNELIDQYKPRDFSPSSYAEERYKTYLEKSKLQEQVNEDIWVRAEQQMEEIDLQRKLEMERMSASSTSSSQDSNMESPDIDFIYLPQHRHQLPGECTVCKVLCAHTKESESTENKEDSK